MFCGENTSRWYCVSLSCHTRLHLFLWTSFTEIFPGSSILQLINGTCQGRSWSVKEGGGEGKCCGRPRQQSPKDGKMGIKINILNERNWFHALKIFKILRNVTEKSINNWYLLKCIISARAASVITRPRGQKPSYVTGTSSWLSWGVIEIRASFLEAINIYPTIENIYGGKYLLSVTLLLVATFPQSTFRLPS
jgi:hypothetical protein